MSTSQNSALLNLKRMEQEFFYARREVFHALENANHVIHEAAETIPELFVHGGGISAVAPGHIAEMIRNIPQMIHLAKDASKSLAEAAESIALPTPADIGVTVGLNYIGAISAIVAGVNLVLDEKNYRQTQNKVKGALSIIAGAGTLAFSYNPALTAAAGLSAGAFAAPAFALITLADLINAAIDFYDANKEVDVERWLHERAKEINYLDKRIAKLEHELTHHPHFTKRKNEKLIDKLEAKKNTLQTQRDNLFDQFKMRSKIYCYGDQDESLYVRDKNEYRRRKNFIKDQFRHIEKMQTPTPNFKHLSTEARGIVRDICNHDLKNKPTNEEIKKNNEIQKKAEERYKEKRINLIMKGLTFSALAMLSVAPFAGPASPVLFAAGLGILTFVAAFHIYKHREKIYAVGKTVANQTKNAVSKAKNSTLFKRMASKSKSKQPKDEAAEKEGEGEGETRKPHPGGAGGSE